jgi:hypothetical protein
MRLTRSARSSRWGVVVAAVMTACAAEEGLAQHQPSIEIYSERELARRGHMFHSYVHALFTEDLLGQLRLRERAALSDVRLVLIEGVVENPLAAGAIVTERTIYLPVQTLVFLDDLAAVAGWLSRQGCSFEPAALYAGMLVSKPPPAGRTTYPNPRAAFNLGDDVWNDPFVKTTSNQVFKTAVFFTLAHELGHIRLRHRPYDAVATAKALEQEMQADAYAIEAMRHVGVPPVGMFHFFTVLSRMEASVPESHPLSGSRLLQIAVALEEAPHDFVPPNESASVWAPVIRSLGRSFRPLIPVIDDLSLRHELWRQARFANWSELRYHCHLAGPQ